MGRSKKKEDRRDAIDRSKGRLSEGNIHETIEKQNNDAKR